MKFAKNKIMATMIALILMLTITIPLIALPTTNAHTPAWNVTTFAFLTVGPNPVGVGQTVGVNFWLDKVPPTANVAFGERWENMTVQVTKPDGTTQTLGSFRSDDVGGAHTTYTPSAVGNYSFQMFFPGQTITGANSNPATYTMNPASIGDYYLPSNSSIVHLVVQQEAIPLLPVTPLPTDYWTRPINGMNPEWKSIAGDYLGVDPGGNDYTPYVTGPESAHIMWTKPIAFGGVVGTNYSDWNYYTGLAYETKFGGFGKPLIMSGRLYFPLPLGTSGSGGGYECVDLRTGEVLWKLSNVTSMSFGQNFDFVSPNEFGIKSYLWSVGGGFFGFGPPPSYDAYDPFTGAWLFSIANASSGTTTFGPNGELIVYVLDAYNNRLVCWNSTKDVMHYMTGGMGFTNEWTWRPQGLTMDWKYGIEWNVTTNSYLTPSGQSIHGIDVDAGVIFATTDPAWAPTNWMTEIGYSTVDGRELWHVNRTAPFDGGIISWNTLIGAPVGDGVFTEFYPEKMVWYGYDIKTGNKIWGPTEPYPTAWGTYGFNNHIAYGMLIGNDFGGYIHAYNITTGKNLWNYFSGDAGFNTPYGIYPSESPIFEADGKIYVTQGHGYSPPLFKGARLICLNATDGTEIWSILSFNDRTGNAIADGYVTVYNNYDGQIYCYGKGPSAMTVAAPSIGVTTSTPVTITGTVTDIAAGTQQQAQAANFPNGLPCVSDASQSAWMEYVYMQQPCPTNATGVPVTLSVIDSNGNNRPIGQTTSDASGTFAYTWTPDIVGNYTVIANFAGSQSYYPSNAEAHFYASTPAPTASPYPVVNLPPTEMYFAISTVAIIIAIAIIGALIMLMLRKRP
jgi:outer membrane protein assembly factor BamB